jgi:hypothetical protein
MPTAQEIAAALTPAERQQYATGQKTLAQIAAARPAKTGAAPAKPAATPAPAAQPAAEPAAAAPAEAAAPAAAPEPAANDASAATDANADPAAQPAPAEGEDGKEPDRFRFKSPEDKAIALLAKTKGITLLEAADLYRGKPATPAAEPAAAATPPVDPVLAKYDTDLAATEAKLKQLTEDRKKAREDVEMEKADSLSDEIAGLTADLRLLKNERAGYVRNSEQTATRTIEQQTDASFERLLGNYPELQTEGSLHRLALDAYVARAINDPKRAHEFADPAWPEKLGAEFATQHALKPKTASAAPAPAAASPSPGTTPARAANPSPTPGVRPKPQQVPGAKSLTSADGNNSSTVARTPEDLQAALRQMTPAQRRHLATQVRR